MNEILIIAGLIFFALLAFLRRDWALYAIVLLLPSYQIRFQISWVPMTFLEGMILILTGVIISQMFLSLRGGVNLRATTRQPLGLLRRGLLAMTNFFARNDKPALIFIALFLLAALLSVFTSPLRVQAAGIFKAFFLEAALVYFLAVVIIDSRKKLHRLFCSLAILVFYLSVFGIYQFVTLANLPFNWWAVDVASRRIISLVNHPNALALLLGPPLALLIFLPKKNRFYWAAIALGLAAFYLSFSRAGWLALVATVLIFGFFANILPSSHPSHQGRGIKKVPPFLSGEVRRGWKKFLLLLSIIVIVIFAIPFSREKILTLVRGDDPAQENRIVLWTAASDMLKKSPLTGSGLKGFHEEFKNYPVGPDKVVQNYPHNFFLNFWLETGLLGLVSIVGLLILFYKKVYSLIIGSRRGSEPPGEGPLVSGQGTLALAAGAAMAMIVLHGMADVPYFKNDLSVLFWLIYSLPFLKID